MILGPVYHWSPAGRRESVLRDGLKVYSDPVTHSGAVRYPYLCFGPTPSSAWSLSGDMEWLSEVERWDLWQCRLVQGDEVHVRAEFGPVVYEVRVRNSIPADRLWWVATREPLSTCARCTATSPSGRALRHPVDCTCGKYKECA